MRPVLVYSTQYEISFPGLQRLHPFDGRKFSRAWAAIRGTLGDEVDRHWIEPKGPTEEADLLRIHTREYLDSLRSPAVVAKALEIWALRLLPARIIERRLLLPMRYAVAGTILATSEALSPGGAMAMNLGGGFHHAFRDHGEGFCLYADVAIAIAVARARGQLQADDAVIVIDLDAHRGNGVWQLVERDPAVRVLDVYNFQVYPGLFPGDVEAFPFQVPIRSGTRDSSYLEVVGEELPKFLAAVGRPRLAFYNAGTDIVQGDPVGRLAVTPDGVAARDRMVIDALADRDIPTVIVTSGGYTSRSHELIARMALAVVGRHAGSPKASGGVAPVS